jgi:GH15 family glucan-1,4-alpha-glucosidase
LHGAGALAEVNDFWSTWTKQFDATGEWSLAVLRSLLTPKALSHRKSGEIVAAVIMSLP